MKFELQPIGYVESPLRTRADAPRQADEGAPAAWLVLAAEYAPGLLGVAAGDDAELLTWLHESARDVLVTHPRGDPTRPQKGVFGTRSPARPNPIGLHRVHIVAIDGARVQVSGLEAIDGTPILDLKGVLADDIAER